MDSGIVTAAAGALGSLLGAAASIATTWMSQRTEALRESKEWKLKEREALYKEFITEASALTVDALTHSLQNPERVVGLYGTLSRIRLVSGDQVVRQGEACVRQILELYGHTNMTIDQVREAAFKGGDGPHLVDPLKMFSSAARDELQALENAKW